MACGGTGKRAHGIHGPSALNSGERSDGGWDVRIRPGLDSPVGFASACEITRLAPLCSAVNNSRNGGCIPNPRIVGAFPRSSQLDSKGGQGGGMTNL